jgi:hypothetical protein
MALEAAATRYVIVRDASGFISDGKDFAQI